MIDVFHIVVIDFIYYSKKPWCSMEKESQKKMMEIMLGCLLLVSIYFLSREAARLVTVEMGSRKTIIIDAGHGGEDPGKVGIDQILEKDINLEIARLVEQELAEDGYQVIMTRTEDVMLGKDGSVNKKSEDLKQRCKIINESNALCAVSIHQNSYSDPAVSGAQVFYFEGSEQGKRMAECLQNALVEGIDPDNHRQAKKNGTYYLLKKTEIPTVIVECGFLSNKEEAKALNKTEYQQKIAEAIRDGIIAYMEGEEAL